MGKCIIFELDFCNVDDGLIEWPLELRSCIPIQQVLFRYPVQRNIQSRDSHSNLSGVIYLTMMAVSIAHRLKLGKILLNKCSS